MSATLLSFLLALFTDPVYGIPLVLWSVGALVWLAYGHGRSPPSLLPYRSSQIRAADPVSAVYWALSDHRYSDTVIFTFQRVAASFHQRYGISINSIPWRRRRQRRLGIVDARPFNKLLVTMVRALNLATTLERPPKFRSWWEIRRAARERKLHRSLAEVMGTVDWMIPWLEGRA